MVGPLHLDSGAGVSGVCIEGTDPGGGQAETGGLRLHIDYQRSYHVS